jgi:hypothetical protein
MNNPISSLRNASMALAVALLASCGAEAPKETPAEAPAADDYTATAIEQRGEPCACVDENIEAMQGLLETLESAAADDVMSASEVNIAVANQMLPCMKPTGDANVDRAYARAMGTCEDFRALTDLMSSIKVIVQSKLESEQQTAQGLDGAQGANEILDKLKGN